jgi:hypothetical protein
VSPRLTPRIGFHSLDSVRGFQGESPTRAGDRSLPGSVVIPEKIARFLEQRGNVAFAGTRNRDLVPFGHRVCGWSIGAGGRTLTAFTPEPFTAGLVESLQENGELALTVEDFPTHETYQFKGRYVSHRPARHEDIAIVDRIRERFMKSMRAVFPVLPDGIVGAFISKPTLAVEFEVSEIFVQTPGPGAGARIVPPAEA